MASSTQRHDGDGETAVDRIRHRVQAKADHRAAERAQQDGSRAGAGPRRHDDAPNVVVDRAPGDQHEDDHPRSSADLPSERDLPGVTAESPAKIPATGWKQILKRSWAENKADNMPIIAAGVAFFGFLAIFPALIAAVSLYGLIASPTTVASQVENISSSLPSSAADLIRQQLTSITQTSGGALTVGLVISILAAVWSASGGVGNLMTAVNIAYDEVETRGFVKRKATALGLTLGAIVFVLVALALVAVLPVLLDHLPLGPVGTVLTQVARWVLLVAVMAGGLSVLYRVAPDRDSPRFRWVSLGSVVITVAWVVVSLLFSFYVNNFGSYSKTYGAIAGVIVLMLWLYLTCYLVLLGAEINAETERQTAHDTTKGEPAPMGRRGADAADTLADPPEPTKESTRAKEEQAARA